MNDEYTLWNEPLGKVSVRVTRPLEQTIGYLIQEKDGTWRIEGDEWGIMYPNVEGAAEELVKRHRRAR